MEVCNLLKACNFQGKEGLDNTLWLIPALSTEAVTLHPHSQPHGRQWCTRSWQNLISTVTTLDLNVQFSGRKRKKTYTNEQETYGPFKGEKKKSAETVPEKDLMADILGKKTFKMPVLEKLDKERCAERYENDK